MKNNFRSRSIIIVLLVWCLILNFVQAQTHQEDYSVFQEKGLYGYKNADGKVVIKAIFKNGTNFQNGFAAVSNGTGWGYIDTKGNNVLFFGLPGSNGQNKPLELKEKFPFTLAEIPYKGAGIIKVKPDIFLKHLNNYNTEQLFGLVSMTGKWLVPPQYGRYLPFEGDFVWFSKDEKSPWYLYSFTGQPKSFSFRIFDVSPISKGHYIVNTHLGYLLMSAAGEVLTEKYDEIKLLKNNLFLIRTKNNYGLMDTFGKILLPQEYSKISIIANDSYILIEKNGLGLLNIDASNFIQYPELRSISEFINGNSVVQMKNGLFGIINTDKKYVIEPNYTMINLVQTKDINLESNVLAFVKNNEGLWGVVSKTGETIIAPQYLDIQLSTLGYFTFKGINNKWGLLDSECKVLISNTYDSKLEPSNGCIAVSKDNKWGYIDLSDNVLIPLIYNKALPMKNNIGVVEKHEKIELNQFIVKDKDAGNYNPEILVLMKDSPRTVKFKSDVTNTGNLSEWELVQDFNDNEIGQLEFELSLRKGLNPKLGLIKVKNVIMSINNGKIVLTGTAITNGKEFNFTHLY